MNTNAEGHTGDKTVEHEQGKARVTDTLTKHIQGFAIPPSPSTLTREIWPAKQVLRRRITELRAEGLSFRRISTIVGLHWTRVAQIFKGK